jgi:hypothetical protein
VRERDEQPLVPAFVTQLLAQRAHDATPDAASVLLAYRHGLPQIAPIFDDRA